MPDEQEVKLIAIYTRKSNDENLNGSVTSIDSQKSACRSYIQIQKDKGWREYEEQFDDAAESGKSLKRPAMQRLLKRIQEGKINGVIVYKLDRLTRNSKDFHYLLELFEKYNVAFISATESIDTKSPQGRLMTAIMVQFAQYDRELDQERSKDFILARAKKGLWCGGIPPLGYDLKDKLLVVNEDEAMIVRIIFDLYLKHKSVIPVVTELNRLGFRRKSFKTSDGRVLGGKHFDIASVIRILKRKVYIGLISNTRTGQNFPGQHKPLISPDVFEKAQELLKSHIKRTQGQVLYTTNKHGFRLKGLVRCGECGSAVCGYVRHKKNGRIYRYYKCISKLNGVPTECEFTAIGAEKLEEFVIEQLAILGWDREFINALVEKARELSTKRLEPLRQEKQQIEARLSNIKGGISNLINLAKETSNSDIAEELNQLDFTKKNLEARLSQIEAEISYCGKVVYDVDVVEATLRNFAKYIYRIPAELQIKTIQLIIKQILVFKDKIRMEIYELPVNRINELINGKYIEKSLEELKSSNHGEGCERKPNTNDFGTEVVAVDNNWRGGRKLNTNTKNLKPVPETKKDYILYTFFIDIPVTWQRITNGEKVLIQCPITRNPNTTNVNIESSNPVDLKNTRYLNTNL